MARPQRLNNPWQGVRTTDPLTVSSIQRVLEALLKVRQIHLTVFGTERNAHAPGLPSDIVTHRAEHMTHLVAARGAGRSRRDRHLLKIERHHDLLGITPGK